MKTKIIESTEDNINIDGLKEAAAILKKGGTVAFPTETVYGLGANALNPEAVNKIFIAKGRPNDNPLIVHIASFDMLSPLVKDISGKTLKLIEVFWPGPLTVILNKNDIIPDEVSAGLETVGIRFPRNLIAQALIKESNLPIAAPSANLSGKPSPTRSEDVIEDLNSRVEAVVISDDSEVGIESTVINMTSEPPEILRPGIISKMDIEKVIGPVILSKGITTKEVPEKPASPGMKYKHYSPNANVVIVTGDSDQVRLKIKNYLNNHNEKIAVLLSKSKENVYNEFSNISIKKLGNNNLDYAHNLFSFLRDLDKEGVDTILVEQFDLEDHNLAVFDRLLHSSNYQLI